MVQSTIRVVGDSITAPMYVQMLVPVMKKPPKMQFVICEYDERKAEKLRFFIYTLNIYIYFLYALSFLAIFTLFPAKQSLVSRH